jgi:hypothetical protein
MVMLKKDIWFIISETYLLCMFKRGFFSQSKKGGIKERHNYLFFLFIVYPYYMYSASRIGQPMYCTYLCLL